MLVENFNIFLLKLPDNCKNITEESITFTVPVKEHTCPKCGEATSFVHDYRNQVIKSSFAINCEKIIVYRRRRYSCHNCGKVFSEENAFIGRYRRMPYSDIAEIISEHGNLSSSSEIAMRHNVSATTVQRLFSLVEPASLKLDEAISIDEFKGNANAKYQVVINSLTTRKCLNILPDRTVDQLYASIMEYPIDERLKVRHVSIDLSNMFRKMVRDCFPNAEIIADHFHAVRMGNDALDTVRKEVQEGIGKEYRRYFKRSRYLLLKREKDLSEEEHTALSVMLNYSDRLSAAYAMKEEYFKMFKSKDSSEFTSRLKEFQKAAEVQDIKPFKTLLKTTIQWKKELIHGIATGYSNGFTEGCNTTIKTLKRICYGFRNFWNFKRRIIFLLNDEYRCSRRKICHTQMNLCA